MAAPRNSTSKVDAFSRANFSSARRAVLDTKRRITQKAKNTFQSEGVILGSDDEEHKNVKKLELQGLKTMLIRLAASIKDFQAKMELMASSCQQMSSCCLELETEKGYGYKYANELGVALAASELNGRNAQSTLKEAGESLSRKVGSTNNARLLALVLFASSISKLKTHALNFLICVRALQNYDKYKSRSLIFSLLRR